MELELTPERHILFKIRLSKQTWNEINPSLTPCCLFHEPMTIYLTGYSVHRPFFRFSPHTWPNNRKNIEILILASLTHNAYKQTKNIIILLTLLTKRIRLFVVCRIYRMKITFIWLSIQKKRFGPFAQRKTTKDEQQLNKY